MKRTVVLTLSLCLLAASSVQATTVRLKRTGFGHVGVTGFKVDYDWDGNFDRQESDRIYTGQYEFAFDAANSSPEAAARIPDTFRAYCVDVDQWAPQGWTDYNLVDLEAAPVASRPDNPMGAGKANDLRELWGRFADAVVDSATGEAFGAAVWEIVFENPQNAYDVGSGALTMIGMSGGAASTANTWLSQLTGDTDEYEQGLFALSHPSYQDFALAGPAPVGQPIPEPLTVAGLGMGVVGLGGYLRRRRQG